MWPFPPSPPSWRRCTPPPPRDPRLALFIVPGLSQASPPDVMRGEETQIAGFLAAHPGFDGVLCLPGTHTKWVHLSAGEVVEFPDRPWGGRGETVRSALVPQRVAPQCSGRNAGHRRFWRRRCRHALAGPSGWASVCLPSGRMPRSTGRRLRCRVPGFPRTLIGAEACRDTALAGWVSRSPSRVRLRWPDLYARALAAQGVKAHALDAGPPDAGGPRPYPRRTDRTEPDMTQDRNLIAILRGLTPDEALPVGEALVSAGSPGSRCRLTLPGRWRASASFPTTWEKHALIGAGTVTAPDEVREVADAGGRLIVSPNFDGRCRGRDQARGPAELSRCSDPRPNVLPRSRRGPTGSRSFPPS